MRRRRKPALPPLRGTTNGAGGSAGADAWRTDDPGYSIDRFYTRGTNEHDHGEYMRVKVAPEVLAELNRIATSRVVPEYESPQDIVRDAIIHRVRWLNDQGVITLSDVGRLMLLRAELAQLQFRQQLRSEIQQAIQRVASTATRPFEEQLLIETLRSRLAELSPDDRQAIVDEIKQTAPLHVQRLVDESLQEA